MGKVKEELPYTYLGPFNDLVYPKNYHFPRPPKPFFDMEGSKIIIEKDAQLNSGIYIWTHTHQFQKSNWRKLPRAGHIKSDKPTILKEGCFLGCNVIITHKCKQIGKYSVIGAGSIVTKDVPDYEIWAGNPAKKIGDVSKEE